MPSLFLQASPNSHIFPFNSEKFEKLQFFQGRLLNIKDLKQPGHGTVYYVSLLW